MGEDQRGFGQRALRASGNAFASGARQNCQNVLTDTPSTYVAAPPGGTSSLCLGWDDAPRGSNGKTVDDASSLQRDGSFAGSCAGLRSLKSCMCRRQSSQTSNASVSQIYDNRFGYGEPSVCVSDPIQRSASAPRLRAKDEVEGSR